LRTARANSSQDRIFKISRAKWTGGVAQAVESQLCKCEALSSNPVSSKKKWLQWLSSMTSIPDGGKVFFVVVVSSLLELGSNPGLRVQARQVLHLRARSQPRQWEGSSADPDELGPHNCASWVVLFSVVFLLFVCFAK
jgi:hypothetical protein